MVAEGQSNGNAEALAYPQLADTGREFFVRAAAQVMDETGIDRDGISRLLSAEAQALWDQGTLEQIMPPCLTLLEAGAQ